jgi:hypothetical protein
VTQKRVFTLRFGARFFLFFDSVFFGTAFFKRGPFDDVFFTPAFIEDSFEDVSSRDASVGGISFETAFEKVGFARATNASAFANRPFS